MARVLHKLRTVTTIATRKQATAVPLPSSNWPPGPYCWSLEAQFESGTLPARVRRSAARGFLHTWRPLPTLGAPAELAVRRMVSLSRCAMGEPQLPGLPSHPVRSGAPLLELSAPLDFRPVSSSPLAWPTARAPRQPPSGALSPPSTDPLVMRRRASNPPTSAPGGCPMLRDPPQRPTTHSGGRWVWYRCNTTVRIP